MNISPVSIVAGILVTVLLLVGVRDVGAELPGNRALGSILNTDATNIMYAGTGENMTVEEYRKGVGHLLDAKPGVLAQSSGQPDPVFYQSKVATPFSKYVGLHHPKNRVVPAMIALKAQGMDPLAVTAEVCRQRGVPVVASFRMNAEDMGPRGLKVFDFARDNPQFRLGDRGCLDPAHPEVYAHRMAIFREVLENYDLDGIEFDFKRWIFMISNPEKNHVILTRMVRETRKLLDEVAKRKGKKRMLLGIRVEPMVAGLLRKEDFPGAQGTSVEPIVRSVRAGHPHLDRRGAGRLRLPLALLGPSGRTWRTPPSSSSWPRARTWASTPPSSRHRTGWRTIIPSSPRTKRGCAA